MTDVLVLDYSYKVVWGRGEGLLLPPNIIQSIIRYKAFHFFTGESCELCDIDDRHFHS